MAFKLGALMRRSFLAIVLLLMYVPAWGAIYYVDSTGGNDSNTGTTINQAWKTINKINSGSFSPGDSILFKRGETWREQLILPSSGNTVSRIVFDAYGSGKKPVITGDFMRNSAVVVSNKSFITINNLCLENTMADGLLIGGVAHHVTVQNCEIRYAEKGIGIYNGAGGGNIFQGNIIHDVSRSGISGNPHTGSSPGNETIVRRNIIYNAGRFGMFCRVNYWIIEENIIYDSGKNTESGTECVGIEIYSASLTDGAGRYNVIRKNIVYGIKSAGNEGSAFEADRWCNWNEFIYNLAYNNDGPGLTIYGATNNKIYNNTFYSNCQNSSGELKQKAEIRLASSVSELTTNVTLINNIAFATRPDVYCIWVDTITSKNNLEISSNCWYKPSGSWWFWGTLEGTDVGSWKTRTGVGTDIFVDPEFTDTLNKKYSLKPSSPCIDKGTNVGLAQDIQGIFVPQGVGVDIGAFESGRSPLVPSSPHNISITSRHLPCEFRVAKFNLPEALVD